MVVGWFRSLVAEHWRLKPEALGSIPGGTTFLSFPLPFQNVFGQLTAQIISIGLWTWLSPIYQAPLCCDDAQILSKSQTHNNYHLSTIITRKGSSRIPASKQG